MTIHLPWKRRSGASRTLVLSSAARAQMRDCGFTLGAMTEVRGDTRRAVQETGKVAPGHPVELGRGTLDEAQGEVVVALGVDRTGRPAIFATEEESGNIVAVWDPVSPESRPHWTEDFTAPTAAGLAALPNIVWHMGA